MRVLSPRRARRSGRKRGFLGLGALLPLCLTLCLLFSSGVYAAEIGGRENPDPNIPDLNSGTDADLFPFSILNNLLGENVEGMTSTLEIILLLTVLTLAPSILVMMTSFTRIVIVLSFTRNAMGTQQMPPNQVLIGLALFLTYFTMFGTIQEINEQAWTPYNNEEINGVEAFSAATGALRGFMLGQIRLKGNEGDLQLFLSLAKFERVPDSYDEIPTHVLIPAFITSELKTAFRMGFYIFIPFIVIDMVVASALMSMGMMMLPPAMISLPFKLMLFVLVNGWDLVVQSVVQSFG